MGLNFKIEHRNQSIGAGVHLAVQEHLEQMEHQVVLVLLGLTELMEPTGQVVVVVHLV